eukprot:Cvel_28471.t1-p1 / transcript=Cvel_28471.t1 / gene=Cvel_28471 / organism=Chromera_velia_CCMP2878 / gene_product=hypothetical protein / transcript_product=hypothetical protein / location=Cvel_scaffold3734:1-8965(-) / protein_length=1300 / sequence_SO=supercontig / SO=protein_coding / is_pseudo=false
MGKQGWSPRKAAESGGAPESQEQPTDTATKPEKSSPQPQRGFGNNVDPKKIDPKRVSAQGKTIRAKSESPTKSSSTQKQEEEKQKKPPGYKLSLEDIQLAAAKAVAAAKERSEKKDTDPVDGEADGKKDGGTGEGKKALATSHDHLETLLKNAAEKGKGQKPKLDPSAPEFRPSFIPSAAAQARPSSAGGSQGRNASRALLAAIKGHPMDLQQARGPAGTKVDVDSLFMQASSKQQGGDPLLAKLIKGNCARLLKEAGPAGMRLEDIPSKYAENYHTPLEWHRVGATSLRDFVLSLGDEIFLEENRQKGTMAKFTPPPPPPVVSPAGNPPQRIATALSAGAKAPPLLQAPPPHLLAPAVTISPGGTAQSLPPNVGGGLQLLSPSARSGVPSSHPRSPLSPNAPPFESTAMSLGSLGSPASRGIVPPPPPPPHTLPHAPPMPPSPTTGVHANLALLIPQINRAVHVLNAESSGTPAQKLEVSSQMRHLVELLQAAASPILAQTHSSPPSGALDASSSPAAALAALSHILSGEAGRDAARSPETRAQLEAISAAAAAVSAAEKGLSGEMGAENSPVVSKPLLLQMVFELVSSCCERQACRWEKGEDLVELQNEVKTQQEKAKEKEKLEKSVSRDGGDESPSKKEKKKDKTDNEEGITKDGSFEIVGESEDEDDDEEGDDESCDEGEDCSPNTRAERKKQKKREKKEKKKRRKILLRELARQASEGVLRLSDSAVALAESRAAAAGAETTTKQTPDQLLKEATSEKGEKEKDSKTTTEGGEQSKTSPSFQKRRSTEMLNQILEDEGLEKRRKEYRDRSVGVLVSAIKAEWAKRYGAVHPLTLCMSFFGFRKLKFLLMEVPNLVITGSGGFMRVATVSHAKAFSSVFPPVGLDADGVTPVVAVLTPSSSDPVFCAGGAAKEGCGGTTAAAGSPETKGRLSIPVPATADADGASTTSARGGAGGVTTANASANSGVAMQAQCRQHLTQLIFSLVLKTCQDQYTKWQASNAVKALTPSSDEKKAEAGGEGAKAEGEKKKDKDESGEKKEKEKESSPPEEDAEAQELAAHGVKGVLVSELRELWLQSYGTPLQGLMERAGFKRVARLVQGTPGVRVVGQGRGMRCIVSVGSVLLRPGEAPVSPVSALMPGAGGHSNLSPFSAALRAAQLSDTSGAAGRGLSPVPSSAHTGAMTTPARASGPQEAGRTLTVEEALRVMKQTTAMQAVAMATIAGHLPAGDSVPPHAAAFPPTPTASSGLSPHAARGPPPSSPISPGVPPPPPSRLSAGQIPPPPGLNYGGTLSPTARS